MDNNLPVHRLHVAITPKLNLAFFQNSVPLLREIVIINEGEESLQEVELILLSDPPFIKQKKWRIDIIQTGQHYRLTNLDVELDGTLLGRLTEAENAQAHFFLKADEKDISCLNKEIELLPRNQWGGIGHMPEIIAAFSQPNEPAVEHLLKKAAEILRNHGKNSALNGYEGGPKRAWELASAIWAAVGSMGIDYALPPASFEQTGQKIRNPGQITGTGIATCMDLTLFFCAIMEQCGLNPLIVFTHGHVIAGVWLKPEEFTTVVVDDITALRKREKLKELVLYETTLTTQRPCPGFKRATQRGSQQISEDNEQNFELAVDIHRARLQRIKPLSSEYPVNPSTKIEAPKEDLETVFEEAPDLPDEEITRKEKIESALPFDRLERWQRRLLDLSLRNRLLNFQLTKRAVKIDAPDPGRLEDLFADGNVFKLLNHPDIMEGSDLRNQAIYVARSNEDIRRAHALDALNRKELMINLSKKELEARLVELYRFARGNLQEGGANTLFLAMGFLRWTKAAKDSKPYRAPLILIPVALQRRSVRSGFTLKLHDDEPRFNPTLIEMLRHDFRLELPVTQGELPRDDHGLNIAAIWESVAHVIKDIRGWEVIEDVILSTFSFAKYLMWKDLVDRTDQLKQNPVVKHLIDTPRETYPTKIEFVAPRSLDKSYAPEQIFCPLSADSSQLSAVIAAANGKDFILIGPPGTGKSQTIVNLIAHSLAENKTVLFVSEKIAALNVVYRRLCEVQLGDFCLEIHSNKARKLDVIQQLGSAWAAKGGIDGEEWKRKAQRLKLLRDQLNKFVTHLHCKRRNGLTVYDAIGTVVKGKDLPNISLSWPSADIHSLDERIELEDLSEKLDINARQVGMIADSPLACVSVGEWSTSWQQSLIDAAKNLRLATELLLKKATVFFKATGIPQVELDKPKREGLALLIQTLPHAAGNDWRFVLRPDARSIGDQLVEGLRQLIKYRKIKKGLSTPWPNDLIRKIRYGLTIIERYREIHAKLSASYNDNILKVDLEQARTEWQKAINSPWPLKRLKKRRIRTTLSYAIEGESEAIELPADIDRLIALQKLESQLAVLSDLTQRTSNLWNGLETRVDHISIAAEFQKVLSLVIAGQNPSIKGFDAIAAGICGTDMAMDFKRLKSMTHLVKNINSFKHLHSKTGGIWDGFNTAVEPIFRALKFQKSLYIALGNMANTPEMLNKIKVSLARLLGDRNDLLMPTGPLYSLGRAYIKDLKRFTSAHEDFFKIAGISDSDIGAKIDDGPESIKKLCGDILKMAPKLRIWCAWCRVKGEAIAHGLTPLVDAVENSTIESGKVGETFKTNYARWWLNATVDQDEVLRDFISVEHEKRIADFKALDDKFTQLTCDYVRAGLCASLPDQQDSNKSSEWGILRHEMQKKKRHMPLRELMNRIPSTICKLAPCLLMSPLSIAQYLSTETPAFDLVIFDEASQIPVWDAIGAIARGKQVVMVGDPKQLPPTSFFDRAESENNIEDVEGDLESILDECLGANLPTLNLSWHYRSRHESLITFSNCRYYGGGLVTFPSPSTEDSAVSLHLVKDGIYEKGGARINKPEAKALVAHIVSRLKDREFKDSGMSIGVVTFNSEQQRLIEDLLDLERRKTPAIETFFIEDNIEPLFVKNLESVQGDERDIMYFSITYGPDLKGAISMNFGPMNRDGGERRLNVAITRARRELLVFSSLKPEQMDLSRTSAIGVRDLKHFMEFAERGPKAISEAVYATSGGYESPFEIAVAEALASKGWQVHPQVGVSSFRIDIGVVDPDAPGRYLAGIECDGATYHRSATARDRDKLREHVLRGLGWNILRIWSTDWWVDSDGALEKVHSSLEKLLKEIRENRAKIESKLKEVDATRSLEDQIPEDGQIEEINSNFVDAKEYNDRTNLPADDEAKRYSPGLNPIPALVSPEPSMDYPPEAYQKNYSETDISDSFSPCDIFAIYQNYEGSSFKDPRDANKDEIAKGLYQIIEVEGPMLCKRAYNLYLRGCGIKRMGKDLKRIMNGAIQHCITQERIDFEDEFKKTGLVYSVVRIKGTPRIILRKRGPRSLEEIPPSEVLVVSHLALKDASIQNGSDEHLHEILRLFNLKRLTAATKSRLLEIIGMEFGYVNDWIEEHRVD